jgi:hypothetical protein
VRNIGDVENPPRDQFVEPGSSLCDGGKKLDLGVRPRRSCVGMTGLKRRYEFAADTHGRLSPGSDDGCFANDLSSVSRERDLYRTVLERDPLNGSLDQAVAFGRQGHRGTWSGCHSI